MYKSKVWASKYLLALYDLEDNLITIFENYGDCAEYIGRKKDNILSFMSRNRNMEDKLIYSKIDKKWYKIYKIEDSEY